MEAQIQRMISMMSLGIDLTEMHDLLVPSVMNEEQFFLNHAAAKILMADIDAEHKRKQVHTTITRPSFRKPNGI